MKLGFALILLYPKATNMGFDSNYTPNLNRIEVETADFSIAKVLAELTDSNYVYDNSIEVFFDTPEVQLDELNLQEGDTEEYLRSILPAQMTFYSMFTTGMKYLTNEDTLRSLRVMDTAIHISGDIELDYSLSKAKMYVGSIYGMTGHYDQAVKYLKESVRYDTRINNRGYLDLLRAYREGEYQSELLTECGKIVNLFYEESGDFILFKSYLRENGENVFNLISTCASDFYLSGDYKISANAYSILLADTTNFSNPLKGLLFGLRGRSLLFNKQYLEARADLETSVSLDPSMQAPRDLLLFLNSILDSRKESICQYYSRYMQALSKGAEEEFALSQVEHIEKDYQVSCAF